MKELERLVGSIIEKIYMNEEYLTFVTDKGVFSYTVIGDCCSHSYFFDFYGVKQLIGNEILTFERVELAVGDVGYRKATYDVGITDWSEEVAVYGFRLTTNHALFGELTSVFSFRNASNGYYGGWMEKSKMHLSDEKFRLTDDLIG